MSSRSLEEYCIAFVKQSADPVSRSERFQSASKELCTWLMLCCVVLCIGTSWFKKHPSRLLHWSNHIISPVPVTQPLTIWINEPHGAHKSNNATTMKTHIKTLCMLYGAYCGFVVYISYRMVMLYCNFIWISNFQLIQNPGPWQMRTCFNLPWGKNSLHDMGPYSTV